MIGNPHVTPQCTEEDFAQFNCPKDSQVGIVGTTLYLKAEEGGLVGVSALYNMEPPPNTAGLLAFAAPLVANPIYIELSARTESDYGLNAVTKGIERLIPVIEIHQLMWGVPAAHVHDAQRFNPEIGDQFSVQVLCGGGVDPTPALKEGLWPCPGTVGAVSNSPELPFLSNPTVCSGPLTSSMETYSFDNETDFAETVYPEITGCQQLEFNPSLSAKPTTTQSDTASGLDVELNVPQAQSAGTPSPSQIKATTVTLPPGFSIQPNAADGKVSCSDAQARIGTNQEAQCPEFSKVGTLEIDSSALPGPLPGAIYLGDPLPGERYRLILAANGFATHIKILGVAKPDPVTGQVVTTFPDLPQSPLTRFSMHFFGSERGLLATPTQCGTYPVHSTFTPWDDELPKQTATQFFTIASGPEGRPCPGKPRPFNPRFFAASAGNTAGAHSPFSMTAVRDDGDQNATALNVATPPGFAATLKGIPYCPESAIAAASAPGHTGLRGDRRPGLPGGESGRHDRRRHRGGHPSAVQHRKGLPRRPVQGRAAQPSGRGPCGRRPLRPRQRRRPGRRPCRPRHGPRVGDLGPDPADPRRGRPAHPLGPRRPEPAEFHAQPDQLQAVLDLRKHLRRRRRARDTERPLPGRELRHPRFRPEARHKASGLDQASRPSAPTGRLQDRCRGREPGPDGGRDAEERAARQQPYRYRLHQGPVRGERVSRRTRSTAPRWRRPRFSTNR